MEMLEQLFHLIRERWTGQIFINWHAYSQSLYQGNWWQDRQPAARWQILALSRFDRQQVLRLTKPYKTDAHITNGKDSYCPHFYL
jgi:hypothetical protein